MKQQFPKKEISRKIGDQNISGSIVEGNVKARDYVGGNYGLSAEDVNGIIDTSLKNFSLELLRDREKFDNQIRDLRIKIFEIKEWTMLHMFLADMLNPLGSFRDALGTRLVDRDSLYRLWTIVNIFFIRKNTVLNNINRITEDLNRMDDPGLKKLENLHALIFEIVDVDTSLLISPKIQNFLFRFNKQDELYKLTMEYQSILAQYLYFVVININRVVDLWFEECNQSYNQEEQ